MILDVLSNTGEFNADWNTNFLQNLRSPNPGQFKEVR